MSRLLSFQAGAETAANTHSTTTTYTSEWTADSANTDTIDANRLMAARKGEGGGEMGRERERQSECM